jgi:riboflavin biosynthesis pyrimidine reductase
VPDLVDDVDIHLSYAADWIGPGGLRANFVASADGAATVAGRSEGLQTPGDNRVFSALRDLADVLLVGAGTTRVEGYSAVKVSARRAAVRERFGFARYVPTAVVSARLHLDPKAGLFAEAQREARTVVITCEEADRQRRADLARVADVVVCGVDTVDLAAARQALTDLGHRRVLCEGGPTLLAGLAGAGLVDELCLSLTPKLVGPGGPRIMTGEPWPPTPMPLWLAMLLEEDGALFARYQTREFAGSARMGG